MVVALRPELRVDDFAPEIAKPRDLGVVWLVVVVVAGAEIEEAPAHFAGGPVRLLHRQAPQA